jgi:hypothetical protein
VKRAVSIDVTVVAYDVADDVRSERFELARDFVCPGAGQESVWLAVGAGRIISYVSLVECPWTVRI